MTTTDTRSTKELFRQWRSGDASAGQAMAQRFSDWYYAITSSRLGEREGREPCERASTRFGEGVVKQKDARELVKWAHEIVQEEVRKKGDRVSDGDDASTYTGGQKPKALLVKARASLPTDVALVELCYTGGDEAKISKLAEPLGGMPLGVLKARYNVKRWLRDNASVPFEVAPEEPVLDRAPLPLYESGRMANPNEEANFEQWMLSDLDLCRDIAEFAQFAIALRGGLPADKPAPVAPPKPQPESQVPDNASNKGGGGGVAVAGAGLLIAGGLVVVVLLVIVVIVGVVMMGGS